MKKSKNIYRQIANLSIRLTDHVHSNTGICVQLTAAGNFNC